MDRRSLLTMLGFAAATTVALSSSPSQALPIAPLDVAEPDAPAPAVATDSDIETIRPEQARWYYRRRYFVRRRFYRRYYRPRFYRRPYFRRRFHF